MIERLWLFHCGWVRVPRASIVAGAGFGLQRLPLMGALAVHADHGPMLIDAPFGHEGPSNYGSAIGAALRAFGWKFDRDWSAIQRVEQLGFRPSDVQHILMTHLHFDHTGGMKELGHAQFHINRPEWTFATGLGPVAATLAGYQLDDFKAMQNRVELFDDPTPIDANPGGVDVLGDGSVRAVGLPGHTIGHVGYRLELVDGRQVLLAGDSAFCVDHVTERAALGVLPRSFAHDADQAGQTLRALRVYHDQHPDQTIIPSHDFGWGERCLDAPEPLDADPPHTR